MATASSEAWLIGFGLMDMQTGAGRPGLETTLFWKHLAAAHLISGVNPAADPARPVIGETHPAAKIGGGFMVAYGAHFTNSKTGLVLVLTTKVVGNGSTYDPGGGNPASPIQPRQIDTKMDDGLADLGDVYAPDDGTCDTDINGVRQYLNTEFKTCILAFNIQ